MATEKQLAERFEQMKKENYRASLKLEGIIESGKKIKNQRIIDKINELKAQYA